MPEIHRPDPTDGGADHGVRLATAADADAVGALLDRFNREYDEATPGAAALATRIIELLDGGDTEVLVGGTGPDAVAVLRYRLAIWSSGLESYLAELYVTPEERGRGLGRAVMEEAIRGAKRRGAESMEIGVDEPDTAARRLYESLGFTNREGGPDGPVMFVYEREL